MTIERHGAAGGAVGFVLRSTIVHVLTYVAVGAAIYWLAARRYWTGEDALPWLRDPQGEFVRRWLLPAQVARGVLFGLALLPLRPALLAMGPRRGAAAVGLVLLVVGHVAGVSGIVEQWVYTTTFHPGLFLAHLPEVGLQALAYGYLLLAWERRAERRRAGPIHEALGVAA